MFIRFQHLLTQSISDRTGLIPVSSHVGMGRFLITTTIMIKNCCSLFLPISTCHDTEALRNVLAFFHVVWINCYPPFWIQLWPWQMVFSRTSHFLALSFLRCWRSMLLIVAGTWLVLTLHKVVKALSMQLFALVSFVHAL